MIKLTYLKPGTSPAALQLEGATSTTPPKITLCKYDASSYEEIICKSAADALLQLNPSKNNWIDVDGLADIETVRCIGEHFQLTSLIIEDILTSQRPKWSTWLRGFF